MRFQTACEFRRLARRWLELPRNGQEARLVRVVDVEVPAPPAPALSAQRETVLLLEAADCGDQLEVPQAVAVRGHFSCGARCRLREPLYTGGNCHIGKMCRLEAVASGGTLVLGAGTAVRSWADSIGWMDLRAEAEVGGVASSASGIRLAPGARARSLVAPEVITPASLADNGVWEPVAEPVVIPHPSLRDASTFRHSPVDLTRLQTLGPETWMWEGDLVLSNPLLLGAKLYVTGSFACGPGSLLEDDVRAGADLEIGPGSVCRGYLTAGRTLLATGQSFLEGAISARLIYLGAGVRACRSGGPLEIRAEGGILLGPDVIVRGSLHSAAWVEAGDGSPAASPRDSAANRN